MTNVQKFKLAFLADVVVEKIIDLFESLECFHVCIPGYSRNTLNSHPNLPRSDIFTFPKFQREIWVRDYSLPTLLDEYSAIVPATLK